MSDAARALFAGRAILVVEDEYLVAIQMVQSLVSCGAKVVGPAADVSRALDLLSRMARLDGAILDIDLRGDAVFPVAEALRTRGVPFVFASGFEREVVPETYRDVSICEKPLDLDAAAAALLGGRTGVSREAPRCGPEPGRGGRAE